MELTNERNSAILMIIIGIIALAFPTVPVSTMGILMAIIVFIIALVLLIKGALGYSNSKILGIAAIILAILCLVFCYELVFNSQLVSNLISIIIYIFGLLIILSGLIALITKKFAIFSAVGLSIMIFGIITILVGVFLKDPQILGGVIGIWLIISGLLSLFTDHHKNYIEI